MDIIKSNFQVIKLEAPEGFLLTRQTIAEDEEPQFTRTVFLAQNDKPENWVLIAKDDVPGKVEDHNK